MQKKGQFFLIMKIMIVGLIASIATVTNSAVKKSDPRFGYAGDEIKFESEKVIDYVLNAGGTNDDMKGSLTAFAQDYSVYSNADNFYYVFGDSSGITFAGLQKKADGNVNLNFDSSSSGTNIDLTKNVFFSNPSPYAPTINPVK